MTDDVLKGRIIQLMESNIKKGHSKLLGKDFCYVMPSPTNYPFQWWWDTCFNIFILCSVELTELAKKNLVSLFEMQRENGSVGHMIFWESVLPKTKLNIYQSLLSLREFRPHMSSLIQPPLAAQALRRIYNVTGDRDFVLMMLPKLKKYFTWLRESRNFDGDELLSIISVFESGLDWKPSYDEVLGFKEGQATEELFKRVVQVEFKNFIRFYNLKKIRRANYFIMKEVMVNTMYSNDLHALSELCKAAGQIEEAEEYEALSLAVSKRIHEIMYDDDDVAFYDVYGGKNKKIKAKSFTIALPLLLNDTSEKLAKRLLKKHFFNPDEFATTYPVPTVALNDPAFNPYESKFMWRGPTWIAANWFIHQCYHNYGFHKEADDLIEISKTLIEKYGFREYYNPFTGEPYGAKSFTWGGLVYDMINQRKFSDSAVK